MSNTITNIKRAALSIAIAAALCVPASASAHILPNGAYVHAPHAESPSTTVLPTYSGPSSGFQWDDAAIGAAGMLGLLGLAGVSSQQLRRRRHAVTS